MVETLLAEVGAGLEQVAHVCQDRKVSTALVSMLVLATLSCPPPLPSTMLEAQDPDQVLQGGEDDVPGRPQQVPVTVNYGQDGPQARKFLAVSMTGPCWAEGGRSRGPSVVCSLPGVPSSLLSLEGVAPDTSWVEGVGSKTDGVY